MSGKDLEKRSFCAIWTLVGSTSEDLLSWSEDDRVVSKETQASQGHGGPVFGRLDCLQF